MYIECFKCVIDKCFHYCFIPIKINIALCN
nr:MAG TPA: hypothetical protein [Caudoviricetes sp.]